MRFSFELHFDADTEQVVRDLWNALDRAGICDARRNGTAPHITLAIADEIDIGELRQELTTFTSSKPRFTFSLESTGMFPAGVVFLSPQRTAPLEAIHRHFHGQFALPDAPNSHLYKPATWTPHCTVATNVAPDRLGEAIEISSRLALPLHGQLEQLVVVRWPDVSEHFRCPLVPPPVVKG
jgi:2'-5' RNA ligase